MERKTSKKLEWDKQIRTVFCCVDSIDARGDIFKGIKDTAEFFVDGRMTAESLRIITCTNLNAGMQYYEGTLFKKEETQGNSCTAKSTIYCANIAAGLMCSQYTKHLRTFPVTEDFMLNIFGEVMEILV